VAAPVDTLLRYYEMLR